jgi:tripartite ATP-independent transporter DctM subunit
MPWYLAAICAIAMLLFLLAVGMPVSFAFAFVGLLGIFLTSGSGKIFIVAQLCHDTMVDFILITVPLFIFMAEVIFAAGFSKEMFNAFERWLGRLPGGLGLASIGTCSLFSAVCGSSWVTAATIGKMAVPEMLNRGYDSGLASGTLAAGGTLGLLIPPSLAFIIYGFMSDISIGKLFMAGVVPGIILSLFFALVIIIQVKLFPSMTTPVEKSMWKEKFRALLSIWPVLVVALVVLGSIYMGMATPSEAAAIGSLLALLLSVVHRRVDLKGYFNALIRTVYTTGFIFLLLIGAKIFSFFLSDQGVPDALAEICQSLGSPYYVLISVFVLLAIMGMVMEGMSMTVLLTPVFVPILKTLGFDPIWFGVVFVLFIETALITPPVGINCYIIRDITVPYGVGLDKIFKGILPFLFGLIATIVVVTIFPDLALWLPGTMR